MELYVEGCIWGGDYTRRIYKIDDLDNIRLSEDYDEFYYED